MRLALALAALLALGGCRDAVAPVTSVDLHEQEEGDAWRLTFSVLDDRAPTWSAAGDSIFYATEGMEPFPVTRGVLLGLPRLGGTAAPLLGHTQTETAAGRWLMTPAASPDGQMLAYAEMGLYRPEHLLPGGDLVCEDGAATAPLPRLGSVRLRVRRLDATGPVEADPSLRVEFAGVDYFPFGLVLIDVYVVRFHPFHALFRDEGSALFRPTWSPDGRRLAFSDGASLRLWELETSESRAIPGTEDGIEPAWSPDGRWIAYTRLERGDSTQVRCDYLLFEELVLVQRRTTYDLAGRTLVLIRPDGGGAIELGPGEEPAWSPDGDWVYYRRSGQVWRASRDGGGAAPVPGTLDGREPALSPDGGFLAFARPNTTGDHDIWVLSLDASR